MLTGVEQYYFPRQIPVSTSHVLILNIARSAGPQWIFGVSDVKMLNLSEKFRNFCVMTLTLGHPEVLTQNFPKHEVAAI